MLASRGAAGLRSLTGRCSLALRNAPAWRADPHQSWALVLNNAADQYAYADGAVVAGPPFSVAVWFFPRSATINGRVFAISDPAGVHWHFISVSGTVAGDPVQLWSSAGSGERFVSSPIGYTVNQWNHVCAVVAANDDVRLYLNGGHKATTTQTINATGFAHTALGTVRFGTSSAGPFLGDIGDARVYGRALGDAEVRRLWDPATRWDLYEVRRPRAHVGPLDVAATLDGEAVLEPSVEVIVLLSATLAGETGCTVAAQVAAELDAAAALRGKTAVAPAALMVEVRMRGSATLSGRTSVPLRLRERRVFKHVDFEVPAWGELAGPPVVTGSGAAMEQSPLGSFPDRPRGRQGVGVRVTLAGGSGQAWIEHDVGPATPRLHVRFLLRPRTLDGSVTLLRGLDAGGGETFRLTLAGGSGQLTAELATGQTLAAALPAGDAAAPFDEWHCVELGLDAHAAHGRARLWIDGVLGPLADVPLVSAAAALATSAVRLGAMDKTPTAAGGLWLDEWVMTDGDIGSVVVEPASAFADDAARWLVVHNSAQSASVAWARRYRAARDVPLANLLGLPLPVAETIDAEQWRELSAAIASYLERTGLAAQVMGILVGPGVPGYVDLGDGGVQPLAALLESQGDAALNPLAADAAPARFTLADLGRRRLTARIDGTDAAGAQDLLDRATTVIEHGLRDAPDAALWLDASALSAEASQPYAARLAAWAESLDRMRTRLPLRFLPPASEPTTLLDDALAWLPSDTGADGPSYGGANGPRVFALPIDLGQASAPALRGAQPNRAAAALAAGYAAVAATAGPIAAGDLPLVRPFIDALRRGWTLGEAWHLARPTLGRGLFLVGDPLLRCAFPRAGWNVFGPLPRLEEMDPETPRLALRADEREAPLPLMGESDAMATLVRRIDGHGRSEAGVTVARSAVVEAQAVRPPLAPAWPDAEGWTPALLDHGAAPPAARVLALWEQPLRFAGVRRLELEGVDAAGHAQTLASLTPEPGAAMVEITIPLPAAPLSLRWRAISTEGASAATPWSASVAAPPPAAAPLPELEVLP